MQANFFLLATPMAYFSLLEFPPLLHLYAPVSMSDRIAYVLC